MAIVDTKDGETPADTAVHLPVVASQAPTRRHDVDESRLPYEHPFYQTMLDTPGLSVATASIDQLLNWGLRNSLWVFPMATSCCGIELMAAAASRVDLDRMGTIIRASPRQADVMVIAGTITVKMAPRVLKLWEQMPEPKWAIAMGSCAISGDFYRDLYSVIPGIDTVLPVDVYIPGCPPNPEGLMHGLMRLQEKVKAQRDGKFVQPELNPALLQKTVPSVPRFIDPARDQERNRQQAKLALEVTELSVSAVHDIELRDMAAIESAPPTEPAGSDAERPLTPDYLSPDHVQEHGPELAALLAAEFGITELPKDGPPIVPVARHHELAKRLRDLGYKLFVYVVASHWPAGRGRAGAVATETEHFEVAYSLRTLGKGSRLATWSVRLEPGEAVPSLVGLFAGADWQEREQFDLVGISFAGHPDQRRLMLPEGWNGNPLRRDYPADAPCAPWR